MFNLFGKKLKNKKGFTLVELIVVIAILGILATVALPRLSGLQESARKKTDIANARTIANIAATLVADGKMSTCTFELSDTTDSDADLVRKKLQSVPELKTTAHNTDEFIVLVDSAGKVAVYAAASKISTLEDSNRLYPIVGSDFK